MLGLIGNAVTVQEMEKSLLNFSTESSFNQNEVKLRYFQKKNQCQDEIIYESPSDFFKRS